jgi:hypothetical protein
MKTIIKNNTTYTLHPQWITGFTDAEGCFSVIIEIKDLSSWKVRTSFEINLHLKDVKVLHLINSYFGVGSVYTRPNLNRCVYRVSKNEELLKVIIPHFSKYPLLTQKKGDFLLWSEVIKMKSSKNHLTSDGFQSILSYYAAINKGTSPKVAKYFPNIKAVDRPFIELPNSLDPNWMTGFVDGDGGFIINIRENKKVEFRFHIAQHSKDYNLLCLFKDFFNSGNVYLRSNLSTPRCDFVVQTFKDILNKVIPHFNKYSLKTSKKLDYLDFYKALLIVNNKKPLSNEDLDKIKELKTGMNKGRIH